MKIVYGISAALLVVLFSAACGAGGGKTEVKGDLASKQKELTRLRAEETKIGDSIKKLEDEIAVLDPSTAVKPRLVSITTLNPQNFTHAIDLQGRVMSDNIVNVMPRNQGGQVKEVYVKQGDAVKKGQLLVRLDDALIRQQIEQANIKLSYDKDLYTRRKNLWDQKIGTEVEVLGAKTAVDNDEKTIDLLKEQLDMANIYSEVSGVADVVTIKPGEFFSPTTAAIMGITIVNTSDLKVMADVPENYLSQIKKGAPVTLEIPDINKTFKSTVSLISQNINTNSRTFTAEAKVPNPGSILKPNQLAVMKITDYTAPNVIVIPMTTLQTDDKGKYVFVQAMESNKPVARKKYVTIGEVYGQNIEVKSGLQSGDQLVSAGFQGLYDGQPLVDQK